VRFEVLSAVTMKNAISNLLIFVGLFGSLFVPGDGGGAILQNVDRNQRNSRSHNPKDSEVLDATDSLLP
jgi:hypothetical protein